MRIYRDLENLPDSVRGGSIAIGNFDGVHAGHETVLRENILQAHTLDAIPSVLTFSPHPRRYFNPGQKPLKIMKLADKIRALETHGIEQVFMLRFNAALAGMRAEDFIQKVLKEALGARHITTGENFIFGAGRGGSSQMLKDAAKRGGFGYSAVKPVWKGGSLCSSTRIRELLAEGQLREAEILLGRPYELQGYVRHGEARGRVLGFPTANILPGPLFLPRFGAYAVWAQIGGIWQNGVANIGVRPTVLGGAPLLEVHLLDFDGDLYGQRLKVRFHQHLRDERKFASLDDLRAGVMHDMEKARAILEEGMRK